MEIFLYGEIGWQVNAVDFIRTLNEACLNHNEVTIAIDSPGGDAFQGLSIYNAIQEQRKRGKVITAHVKVIAASAASFIAVGCDKVIMNDYSMMMIHKASGYVRKESDFKRLGNINQILKDLYAKKTGIKDKALDDLLDKEHWMSASEAVEQGFADEIKFEEAPIEAMSKVEKVRQLMAIDNHECMTESMLVTALIPFYKTGQTDKKILKQSMLEKINAALSLDVTASEVNAVEAISKINEQMKAAKADLKIRDLKIAEIENTIKAKDELIAQFEEKAKADLENRAIELVEAAFVAGKISEDQKLDYLELAKEHFDKVKNILDGMKSNLMLHQIVKSSVAGSDSTESTMTPLQKQQKEISDRLAAYKKSSIK